MNLVMYPATHGLNRALSCVYFIKGPKMRGRLIAGGVLLFAVAGCSSENVVAPHATATTPTFALTTSGVIPAPYRSVMVCKTGSTATFEVSVDGGPAWQESFADGECRYVYTWNGVWSSDVEIVTVTELPMPGVQLDSILKDAIVVTDVTRLPTILGVASATGAVNGQKGAVLHFFNSVEPPDTGLEGCTPGYWKQPHHFDSWPAGLQPDQQFSSVFADAFSGKTLLNVLELGGGGLNALGRHAVAALLSSGSVDYGMSPSQVIGAFNVAFASGEYSSLHSQLEAMNERGCPLS